MSTTLADFERLGAAIVSRRVEIGHRVRGDFAAACGLSVRTLGDLENARRSNFDPTTFAVLEHGLGWEAGSAIRVLDGFDPIIRKPADDDAVSDVAVASDAAVKVVVRSGLPDYIKKRIIQVLVEDRVAADRRRIDLAHSLIEAVGWNS